MCNGQCKKGVRTVSRYYGGWGDLNSPTRRGVAPLLPPGARQLIFYTNSQLRTTRRAKELVLSFDAQGLGNTNQEMNQRDGEAVKMGLRTTQGHAEAAVGGSEDEVAPGEGLHETASSVCTCVCLLDLFLLIVLVPPWLFAVW